MINRKPQQELTIDRIRIKAKVEKLGGLTCTAESKIRNCGSTPKNLQQGSAQTHYQPGSPGYRAASNATNFQAIKPGLCKDLRSRTSTTSSNFRIPYQQPQKFIPGSRASSWKDICSTGRKLEEDCRLDFVPPL